MRIVLLGDSHLDRVRRDVQRLAPTPDDEVLNAAVGGSFAFDLLPQARAVLLHTDDVVVISVGTNDAAPWKEVEPYDFDAAIEELLTFLSEVGADRLVYLTPPGVDEARLTGAGGRPSRDVYDYSAAAVERFGAAGARLVDACALLQPLGARAFTDDGMHLTGAAYDVLLPVIAEEVAALAAPGQADIS